MTNDEKYIARCILLAKNGLGSVSPNPMVGAVIVYEDRIIGEGYHIRCGGPHAEVNAINSVRNESLLKESTIYVSLEPCSHYGKTPPCADLIIKKGIPRVVVGCVDPFSKVAGRGIRKLQDAGIDVTVGVLEKECLDLIKSFSLFNTLRRPYIILKWAESADGFLDRKRDSGVPVVFSTPLTSMLVHKRRAEVDGIFVGTRTALLDNPSLTVRIWSGQNPVRIVLDENLSLPTNLHLFDDSVQTLVFTALKKESLNKTEYISVDFNAKTILNQILSELYSRNIETIMVEGGGMLLQSFIDQSLWDEAYVEKSKILLGEGVEAPCVKNSSDYDESILFGRRILHYMRFRMK